MLQANQLHKSFPQVAQPILNGITFSLEEGDFCVLIGSNGSGKTTLLKALSGEYTVDTGSIILNDQDITSFSLHQRAKLMSTVSQDIAQGTILEMTLLENLSLSLRRQSHARFTAYRKQSAFLKEKIRSLGLGLERYWGSPLSSLSGGQRQMVAMCMATLCKPLLLLLDEHCSALDPKMQAIMMASTAQVVSDQKITTLMITHHLNDAIRYGNRLIMLHQGEVVVDKKGEEKSRLTLAELLDLFHAYENTILVNGE